MRATNGMVHVIDSALNTQDSATALSGYSAVRVLADVFPLTYALTEKAQVIAVELQLAIRTVHRYCMSTKYVDR